MYPLIISAIAADRLRESHEYAARARAARDIRRRARAARPVPPHAGRARGPLTLARALGRAKA